MTVTDQKDSFYLSHSFPLTSFSALRQEYYCFCVPEMGVLGIGISASGRARNGFPISSKSAKVDLYGPERNWKAGKTTRDRRILIYQKVQEMQLD